MAHRWFVTGTDTGIGKTEVSAALLSALVQRGERPFAFKPFESGGTGDADRLRAAAGGWQGPGEVCVYQLAAPLAPYLAARAERRKVSVDVVLRRFEELGPGSGVVEGAGGLHVPLDARHDVIDLMAALGLPAVVVARAGLGTINHTSLTLDVLHDRGLTVAAVVLVQARPGEDPSIAGNPGELRRRYPGVPVLGPVPFIRPASQRREAFLRVVGSLVDPGRAHRVPSGHDAVRGRGQTGSRGAVGRARPGR